MAIIGLAALLFARWALERHREALEPGRREPVDAVRELLRKRYVAGALSTGEYERLIGALVADSPGAAQRLEHRAPKAATSRQRGVLALRLAAGPAALLLYWIIEGIRINAQGWYWYYLEPTVPTLILLIAAALASAAPAIRRLG
jgi:hypothetical protein